MAIFDAANPYRRISIVFVFILLFSVLYLIIGLSSVGDLNNGETETNSELDSSEMSISGGRLKKLQGRVFPSSDYGYIEGSHVLLDDEGEVSLILKSKDDKLLLVVGMEVEVVGKLKNSRDSDLKIMEVETVNIK